MKVVSGNEWQKSLVHACSSLFLFLFARPKHVQNFRFWKRTHSCMRQRQTCNWDGAFDAADAEPQSFLPSPPHSSQSRDCVQPRQASASRSAQPNSKHLYFVVANLDPLLTPVWYRRFPANRDANNSRPRSMGMATTMRSMGVPVGEMPSPAASDTSLSTRQGDVAPPRSRSRARRSPSRLPLRTAFRNFSGVVQVVVGEESDRSRPQTSYLVHKELLTSASPFFAAALNSTFAEGMDQKVTLPEEKPEIFEWFLQWLYTGSLTTPLAGTYGASAIGASVPFEPSLHSLTHIVASDAMARTDGDLRNSAGSPKYFLLIDLYALSDRLLTTPLSNHILSTIARLSEATNSVPTPSDTFILYDSIRDNSPLRTLVLDLFAYKKTDKLLETHKDDWHAKFLRELVVKLKRPGSDALERHNLVAWRPRSWSSTKACEWCRDSCKPGISADKCCACEKAFCENCIQRYQKDGFSPQHDTSGCKPWMGRGMCARYHEHADGEPCQ